MPRLAQGRWAPGARNAGRLPTVRPRIVRPGPPRIQPGGTGLAAPTVPGRGSGDKVDTWARSLRSDQRSVGFRLHHPRAPGAAQPPRAGVSWPRNGRIWAHPAYRARGRGHWGTTNRSHAPEPRRAWATVRAIAGRISPARGAAPPPGPPRPRSSGGGRWPSSGGDSAGA